MFRSIVAAMCLFAAVSGASAQDKPARAIFAGGCFWCVEADFDKVPGVLSTTSGYIGGKVDNPTYNQVSAGGTGHAEAVEIVYDPAKVTYAKLLDVFWRNVDPLAKDKQFCDSGDQYRTREITRLELELSALRSQVTRLENKVAAASANAEHYSFLFNNSPVGDLVLDERGMILDSNRQARLMLGVNSARMLSGAFAAFVAKDEIPEFLNHLRRCSISQGTVSTELKLTLKPGRQLPVELLSVPIRGEVALVKKFRTLLIDISRRETAKTALQLTQGNYRALLDSLHGIVWEADPQTLDVLFVSQSAERLLGYSADIWYQPSFWPQHIHLADRDRILSELSRAVAAGEGHQALDYRMLDSQRRVVWVRDTLTVFKHQGKTRLLGVAVDIESVPPGLLRPAPAEGNE